MDLVPPKTTSHFGKQCCRQEDLRAKGCICLPHSIGSTGWTFLIREEYTFLWWLTPTLPGETIPGQLRSPPDSWPPTCHWHGPQEPAQPTLLLNILPKPQPGLLSTSCVDCSSWEWLHSLWHARHSTACSVLQVRRGHVKTSVFSEKHAQAQEATATWRLRFAVKYKGKRKERRKVGIGRGREGI